jgi:hypothetical protein
MSTNMELIETKTVGSGGAASIDFTSIPQTYTDLIVKISARQGAENAFNITFNGSTSAYSTIRLQGDGANATSNTAGGISTAISVIGIESGNNSANIFGNSEIYIPNYTSSNNKSVSIDGVNEENGLESYMNLAAGLWSNTAAINQVTISARAGSLVQHSTASLYGISSVTSTPKATGGIVSQDATHWYHMFPFTSTFTPTAAISADILCIGGGAAGGFDGGGGGGAGGIIYFASQSLTTTNYSITVGAGGAGGGTTSGNDGSNSVFGSLTAGAGGGGGGVGNANNSRTGGSGGGGGAQGNQPGNSSNQSSTGATAIYGNSGGTGSNSGSGGGGGGAGSAGASSSSASAGGAGTNAFSSWANSTFTSVNGFYGGGGGGGTGFGVPGGRGGTGGGGAGGGPNSVQPSAGIVNTGGGGGGGNGNPATSASGGSGLVIVRYAK